MMYFFPFSNNSPEVKHLIAASVKAILIQAFFMACVIYLSFKFIDYWNREYWIYYLLVFFFSFPAAIYIARRTVFSLHPNFTYRFIVMMILATIWLTPFGIASMHIDDEVMTEWVKWKR